MDLRDPHAILNADVERFRNGGGKGSLPELRGIQYRSQPEAQSPRSPVFALSFERCGSQDLWNSGFLPETMDLRSGQQNGHRRVRVTSIALIWLWPSLTAGRRIHLDSLAWCPA